MMRPPFAGPMRMPMRGPPLPMGVRPMMEGQPPPPPMGFPGGHPGGHPGVIPPHPMSLQQPPRMEVGISLAPLSISISLNSLHCPPVDMYIVEDLASFGVL